MAGTPTPNQDIFDVRKIRRLVELMKEHDLSEIDLRQQDTRIQLRRGAAAFMAAAYQSLPMPSMPAAFPSSPSSPHALPAQSGPSPAAAVEENYAVIKSPMVGTFYSASDPEASPYVKVGDHIGPETTVCIVEAMKVFNEIPAETSGKIIAVLAKNGEPVEFGQPLFKVDAQG